MGTDGNGKEPPPQTPDESDKMREKILASVAYCAKCRRQYDTRKESHNH